MKTTVSKILNRTDLGESGSHGGLVVTRDARPFLLDFFEGAGVAQRFQDENGDVFSLRYVDYTLNGTTPNGRVTPIGRYATQNDLRPGDNLVLQRIDNIGNRQYIIAYMRKMNSVYFVGKSRESMDVLDNEQMNNIMQRYEGNQVRRITETEYEMQVRYQSEVGTLTIRRNNNNYEMYFNGEHIEENNKYFELGTLTDPFELKKMETWKIEIDADDEDIELNEIEEQHLAKEMENIQFNMSVAAYVPQPENKRAARNIEGRMVPHRDTETASRALARAGYLCEYDNSHELFLRKKQPVNYTEPHHLIPLQYDNQFENSLDVQANIVSLCSHCHNLVHYGADAENVIRKLWEDRREEIKNAGIGTMRNGVELTIEMLLGFYGIK